MGGIELDLKLETEIIKDIQTRDDSDFTNYLGIDSEDMRDFYEDIDFDDVAL